MEPRLGETFNQFHKNLPKEGLNSDEEGYEPIGDVTEILKRLQEILRQERDQAIEVIKRIRSSRELTQRFQIFDIFEGSQVNNDLFQQNQDGTTRHLMLAGFHYEDRKRFPGNWRVTMTQFVPEWADDPDYAGLMLASRAEKLVEEHWWLFVLAGR